MMELLLAVTLLAPPDSHAPVPPSAGGLSPSELLARKLAEVQAGDVMQRVLKNPLAVNPKLLEQLRDDPKANDILRRLRDGDPELMALAQRLIASDPRFQYLPPDVIRDLLPKLATRYGAEGPFPDQDSELDPRRPPIVLPPPAERERMARQAYAERINDLLRDFKLDGVASSLQESSQFRDVLRDLAKSGAAASVGSTEGLLSTLERLDGWLKDAKRLLPKRLPASLANLRFHAPAVTARLPDFSLGTSGLPSPSSVLSPDGWTGAVAGVIVVLAALTIWRLAVRRPRPTVNGRWRLGPWPVDPRAVATRDDLIRAFEYLALLRLGPQAQHWHHRQVAERLAATSGDPEAVTLLAELYERARYAPDDRSTAWESGQAALNRLAGTAA